MPEKENYIVDESPEISVGERLGWAKKIAGAFPALESKNYRYYFAGQLISQVGTWLQIVAQSWLVWQLTNSALLLGIISAIGSLPVLLFSLFGGVIVDRFAKKKILILTQTSAMLLAFVAALAVRCIGMLYLNYYFAMPVFWSMPLAAALEYPAALIIIPNALLSIIEFAGAYLLVFRTRLRERFNA